MFVNFFIRRPVFATVCALLIVLAGAVVIPSLPISLYPQLAPPQVTVTSNYVGANAQVVESAVTIPLEQQINGVPGMRYIQSTSGSDGTSQITTTFDTNYNLDIAAVDVQNRVSTASGQLPAEVNSPASPLPKPTATSFSRRASISDNAEYSNLFISNYLDVYVKDALKRIPGVGDVQIFGERKYAMRIWLDPTRLAARVLTASDVVNALREQNVVVAAGQLGQPPSNGKQDFQITVSAAGRLSTPDEFNRIIVKNTPNGIVQLKDVGHAELGAETYGGQLKFNGIETVGIGVQQLSNANALEVDRQAKAALAKVSKTFPPGMKYVIAFDTTTVVGDSIREVVRTLGEAIVIVIVVIFLFLQDWRATIIPAVTIPVSLVGTFAFIKIFGFSINSLTLFGITLATGLVVDDAIVVIENVQRHITEGDSDPHHATSSAMAEVTGAVIATSLVLISVFIPVSFFPGTTGILYKQFSLTIAFSIAISAFNALTLSPALAALLLRKPACRTDFSMPSTAASKACPVVMRARFTWYFVFATSCCSSSLSDSRPLLICTSTCPRPLCRRRIRATSLSRYRLRRALHSPTPAASWIRHRQYFATPTTSMAPSRLPVSASRVARPTTASSSPISNLWTAARAKATPRQRSSATFAAN